MDELAQMDAEIEQLAATQRQNPRASPPPPATFEFEAVYDDEESKKSGRPVYRNKEMITIRVGALDNVRHEVTDKDRRIYAAQYVAWRKSEDPSNCAEGFPLAQWAMIPGKAVVKELAHYDIRSVEQLANVTDAALERIGPYKQLRQHARDWVADAQKQAPLIKLRQEVEQLRAELAAAKMLLEARPKDPAAPGPDPAIAALQAQISQLAAAVKTNGTPKRRGRPPKPKADPPPEA